jgi:hypothetical protein
MVLNISDLNPEEVLAQALDGQTAVQIGNESHSVKAYSVAKKPSSKLPDEFITTQINGVVASITKPRGLYSGNIALTIYCVNNANDTAKTTRLKEITRQCEALIDGKRYGDYFFEFDPTNVITPPTVNLSIGYATTVLNVAWHT